MTAPSIPPARAPVRPRVQREPSTAPLLLEEEIAELLLAGRRVDVCLCGGRGLGKTTALAHLAATFADDVRLRLVDGVHAGTPGAELVTVRACRSRGPDEWLRFDLLPWTDDEVLEYLLAMHPDRVGAALVAWQRGPEHDLRRWPGTCRDVLDVLASDAAIDDPLTALPIVVRQHLGQRHAAAADHALRTFVVADEPRRRIETGPPAIFEVEPHLLGSSAVLGKLAAARVLDIATRQPRGVHVQLDWSTPLRIGIQHALRTDQDLAARLLARAGSCRLRHKAIVMSALCVAQPAHRPARPLRGDLSGAWLRGIDLSGMHVRARLQRADLGGADLRAAHFDRCDLSHASLRAARAEHSMWSSLRAPYLRAAGLQASGSRWPDAELRFADFSAAQLEGAGFRGARMDHVQLQDGCLRGADLSHASLGRATLVDADLQQACCEDTHFEEVDLRRTGLDGANCRGAWFVRCNLAGTALPGFAAPKARFTGSDLTGARWRGADLAGASFQRAGLAEVDWEGVDLRDSDLRRASFHLGNARSGLVDSTIASEGSRTGFYTDESLEEGFLPPEDVRKANLRECDLRGARLDGTDFYLVDVRGARLDAGQRDWLRRCRAILDRE